MEVSTLVAPEAPAVATHDIHPDTLGRLAVAPVTETACRTELNSVREQLRDMKHTEAELFDDFCEVTVPADLRAEKTATAPDSLWNAWLVRDTSDRQLLEFLDWNVDSIRQQQADDRFQSLVANERQKFKRGVSRGLAEGWLHDDFEAAIDGVDDLRVYVGDAFNTQARGRAGYFIYGSDEVVIAGARRIPKKGFGDLHDKIHWVAPHEFTHPFGRFEARWLNEAATEHSSQAYRYKQPHIIRPNDRRHNYNQNYAAERALAADFMGDLAVRFITLAYSQTVGNERLNELIEVADAKWAQYVPAGRTAFGQINTYMRFLESQYQLEGQSAIAAGSRAADETRRLLNKDPAAVFTVQDDTEQYQRLLSQ